MTIKSRTYENSGCPEFWKRALISKGENAVATLAQTLAPDLQVVRNSRAIIKPFEIDIYFPEIKLGIEYNGEYWHSSEESKRRDKQKIEMAQQKGIALITIWEKEWQSAPEVVERKILKSMTAQRRQLK